VRHLQFFLGVMTVLFLPVPLVDGAGAGSIIEDFDRLAWTAMIVLIMTGSLVATAMPRATLRLFGSAGAIGVLFGIGTLTPMLVSSGIWTLLLAGIGLLDRRTRRHLGISGLRYLRGANQAARSSAQASVQ
jgi:hypothetical protein